MVLLGEGLAPFVARECAVEFGEDWTTGVQRADSRGDGRTRMANPVDPQFLLILPSTIPIDDSKVSEELLRHLESEWRTVVEADVDGNIALPLKLDKENPNLGRFLAARKVARTVYFGSAPSQHAANKGLDDRSIKLGCIQPGEERPAIFGDALRKLSDQASYLYRDGARYWYALQANVNRIARDRAEGHFNNADVDDEIRRRLDVALRDDRGQFSGVHNCPRSPADVPDTDDARLVVLDPTSPHDSKTEQSEALKTAQQTLVERAGGARQHRNMVVFLAADVTRLGELRQAVRNHLAWQSIRNDSESLNLDPPNARQAESKAADADEMLAAIEVEATAEDGFDDDVQRTITENAATLKFNDSDFET